MKKVLIPALSGVLLSVSVATMAHMPGAQPGGMFPGAGPQAKLSPELQAFQQEMQAKLATAKTPEERDALMKEQHEKMRDKMPEMARTAGMHGMMGMRGMGH